MITTPISRPSAAAFLEFVNKVPFYGAAILCLDDENVQQILPRNRRAITYGEQPAGASCRCTARPAAILPAVSPCAVADGDLGEFHLNVPGFHNVLNATAALAIGLELGVEVEKARQALDHYSGVDRRFQGAA